MLTPPPVISDNNTAPLDSPSAFPGNRFRQFAIEESQTLSHLNTGMARALCLVLALTLALTLASPALAQEYSVPVMSEYFVGDVGPDEKRIRIFYRNRGVYTEQSCSDDFVYIYGHVAWTQPLITPDYYRVSWTVNKSWLSWRKPNVSENRRGNAFVTETSYQLPAIKFPKGKTLTIRVRAGYNDEDKGPWTTGKIEHPCNKFSD